MAYPTTIDSFTTKVDDYDRYHAIHMNSVQTSIVNIETELGTDPAGVATDVKTRLANSLPISAKDYGTNQAALNSAIAAAVANGGGIVVIPPSIGYEVTIPEITNVNVRVNDLRVDKDYVATHERSNLQLYLKQIAGGFTHPLTLIKRAAGGGQPYEFDVFMPCNRHGSKYLSMRMSSYNTKDPSESNYGVLRMGEGNVAITERPITRIEQDTTWATLVKTGTWNAWLQLAGTGEWYTFSTDYTTPATITATVKGSNIWMAAPCATNGGRCYVTVDGTANNANKLKQTGGNAYIDFDIVGSTIHKHIQIAEGLADTNHTVVFTHVNNGTPTARTYFSSIWGTDAKDSSGILDEVMAWGADFRAWDSLGNRCDDTVMSPTASAFEYAFWNREPGVGSYGWSGTIHGWEDYEYIKIYADGELVNDYYTAMATNDCIWCNEIVIVQQSKLLTPGNAARVWGRMRMVHTFTPDGVNVKMHLVYLLAQQLGDSYRAMLPTMDIYSSSISRIFGTGKGRIETTGIANTINGNPGVTTDYDTGTHTTCGVLWSAESDLVYVMKIANQGMVGDFANSERDFFLQDRTDDNNKIYCQMYNTAAPTTVPAGTIEDTDITYQFMDIPDADLLLTNFVERL